MTQDQEKTTVLFRKFSDGEVIALFPDLPGTNDPRDCSSYMHVGQHGTAHYNGLAQETKPTTKEEYQSLVLELEDIGYSLVILKSYQPRKGKY